VELNNMPASAMGRIGATTTIGWFGIIKPIPMAIAKDAQMSTGTQENEPREPSWLEASVTIDDS
jgi:hypothetical protein